MTAEDWVAKLEAESRALKSAFDRNANSLLLKSYSTAYATVRNQVTINYSGGSSQQDDAERVIVTFDTAAGVNTIAKLELTTDNQYARPYVRRLPYTGGAKWSVTCSPKNPYSPTNINFTVRSLVAGVLKTSEVSS